MLATVISKLYDKIDVIEKRMQIWTEVAKSNAITQRATDQAMMILKKGSCSDLEILEIYE